MSAKLEFETRYDREAKLLYSMIVAGKSANFTDRALREFLRLVATATGTLENKQCPFDMLARMSGGQIMDALKAARTGNYTKLAKGIFELLEAFAEGTL